MEPSEPREIAVRRHYLVQSYWQNQALTATKFLPDPTGGDERVYLTRDVGEMLPDGCLINLGRKDFQVKIRGYNVDVPGVGTALHDLWKVK